MPFAAAKSMYRRAFAVVAPCFGPERPGHRVDVHAPPDADVLHRMDPVRAGQGVRRIEIQAEQRRREIRRAVGELNRSPRRDERRAAAHLDPVGERGERRAQRAALHPRSGEEHSRVVHEVRLVDDHEGPAVAHLHRQRSLYAVERADRSRRVEHLRIGPFVASSRESTRHGRCRRAQTRSAHSRSRMPPSPGWEGNSYRKPTPSSNARTLTVNRRFGAAVSTTSDGQFVVMVAHASHLAPRLRPPFVVRLARGVRDAQPVAQRNGSAELKAEQRWKDQRAPIALEAVVEPSLVDRDRDFVATIRRSDHALASKWADRRRKRDGSKAAYDEPRWSSHAAIVRSGAGTGHRQRGDALFQRRTIDSTSTP